MITKIKVWKLVTEANEIDKTRFKLEYECNDEGGDIDTIDVMTGETAASLTFIVEPDKIYLEWIRVWEGFRGLGLVKYLFEACEEYVKRYGKREIYLSATPLDEDTSLYRLIELYQSLGYQVESFTHGGTAARMWKLLPN